MNSAKYSLYSVRHQFLLSEIVLIIKIASQAKMRYRWTYVRGLRSFSWSQFSF